MEKIKQNTNTLEDQITCLNFELKTISKIVNLGQLERWVPDYCNPYTNNEHIERYIWVSNFVNNNYVLDIACGVGKGSYILAEKGKAKKILGCDLDEETIQYASIKNKHPLIKFEVANAETIENDNKFQTIISFETIEHLKNPRKFLASVKNLLEKDGYFFVSTPVSKKEINNNPSNTYHEIEWGFLTFQNLVKEYFEIENIYIQLYQKRDNILQKILKKLLKINQSKILNNMTPFLWSNKPSLKRQINNNGGYQILQCKIKNDNMFL